MPYELEKPSQPFPSLLNAKKYIMWQKPMCSMLFDYSPPPPPPSHTHHFLCGQNKTKKFKVVDILKLSFEHTRACLCAHAFIFTEFLSDGFLACHREKGKRRGGGGGGGGVRVAWSRNVSVIRDCQTLDSRDVATALPWLAMFCQVQVWSYHRLATPHSRPSQLGTCFLGRKEREREKEDG